MNPYGMLRRNIVFHLEIVVHARMPWLVIERAISGEPGQPSKRILPRVEGNLPAKGAWTFVSTLSSDGDKKAKTEKLWGDLFSNPSEWRDHRLDNVNPRFPDFKHKKHALKALWMNSVWIPPWVKEKLAALPPGTIALSNFAWNERLSKCAQAGEYEKTMELFEQMQRDGTTADRYTFFPVLKACSSLGLLEHGRRIHAMMQLGADADLFLGSCLVDMYAKCGSIREAERVFNKMPTTNVVAWNAMIGGYLKCGEGQKALEQFDQMQRQGVVADSVTFMGVLNACASIAALEQGKRAHEEIVRRGYESNVILATCLVDMYAKCGGIEEAKRVFNAMPTRDVMAWNAMILGYVKCGEGQKALELLDQMEQHGVDPDPVSFVGVLNACAIVAELERGRHAHQELSRRGYESNVIVRNCLVDMYAKCGSIEEAERVFNQMPTRDVVAWNAMILGYGSHGDARKALETFKHMSESVEVDDVTFLSILSACSHGGLVDEGVEYLKSMRSVYNLSPTVEHFTCVVDLLGRAGRLNEAEDLILSMPMEPDATAWGSLLGACRVHVNVEVGEHCAKRLQQLDPETSSAYVMLSDIYVAAGK